MVPNLIFVVLCAVFFFLRKFPLPHYLNTICFPQYLNQSLLVDMGAEVEGVHRLHFLSEVRDKSFERDEGRVGRLAELVDI